MALKDYLIKNGMGSIVKELDHTIGDKIDKKDISSEVKEGDKNPVSGGAVFDALKNIWLRFNPTEPADSGNEDPLAQEAEGEEEEVTGGEE